MCFCITRSYNTNQQGPDKGSLSFYCFYKNAAEKKIIEDKIKNLPPIVFTNPIVTEVKPVMAFYAAGLPPRLC
jgi:peptide-methionine (S)-S-oxide reductase